jgi:outer membrane protein assembly factor BamB
MRWTSGGLAALVLCAATCCAGALCAGDDLLQLGGEEWPRWRGPRGDGTWRGAQLPDEWPKEGLPVRWRQPIGPGYSGVSASDGRVYTMDRPTVKGDGESVPDKPAEAERVVCFDASTGKLLWSHRYQAAYGDLDYGKGPRAAPTIAGGRVYTLGAVGHVHCLEAAGGKVVWSREVAPPAREEVTPAEAAADLPMWGLSASPLVFEKLVIVQAGAKPDGCLIAFDASSGKDVWRSLPEVAGYATPILIERGGRSELVAWTAGGVHGLDPRTGKVQWSVPFELTYGTAIATPIYREETVFVASYFEGSKAIRLGEQPADAKSSGKKTGTSAA